FRQVKWGTVWNVLEKTALAWIVIAMLFNLSDLPLRAWQWRVFLPRDKTVTYGFMLEISALMTMTMNTVPFMAGHALGTVLLGRRTTQAASFSVLALDQLAEGFCKLSLVALTACLAPLPVWLSSGVPFLVGGVVILFIVLSVAAFHGERMGGSPIDRVPAERTHRWIGPAIRFFRQWSASLEALRNPWQFIQGLVLRL
ncbi:MAG: flippase-like domain-containing protein, partial [Deltaproteobacteria bacterium]|nr:flippase-like domain-containing protein [Deltaproteobacteria bacterium]